jgi:hypothetical protein
MAASISIEQESGTYTRPFHRHKGYYAGDFSTPGPARRAAADSFSVSPALLHPGLVVHERRRGAPGLPTGLPRSDS